MKVFVERFREEKELVASSVGELLSLLELNPETVLVVKNGVLVTEDELLADQDEVKVLSVISGG